MMQLKMRSLNEELFPPKLVAETYLVLMVAFYVRLSLVFKTRL